MKPGIELDRLFAAKVFGLQSPPFVIPYSRDACHIYLLLRLVEQRGLKLSLHTQEDYNEWRANVHYRKLAYGFATGESPSHALCLALLALVDNYEKFRTTIKPWLEI